MHKEKSVKAEGFFIAKPSHQKTAASYRFFFTLPIKTLDDMANKTLSKQGTISPSVINIAYNIFSVNPENVSKVIDEGGDPPI